MPLLLTPGLPFDATTLRPDAVGPLHDALRARGVDASLAVHELEGDAVVLGRFQRARSAVDVDAIAARSTPIARRTVGGPAIRVGSGVLFVRLLLDAPTALGGVADPERALNRHVRPLLRALESLGAPATWGGRDVILVRGAPVAWVGVGHSVATRAMVVEAFVGVASSFALAPELDLATGSIAPRFLGRAPRPLDDVLGKPVGALLQRAILDAYAAAAGGETTSNFTAGAARPAAVALPDEPPFTAMVEEAIGLVGARYEPEHERVAIGGDLGASEDALAALELALFAAGRDATEEQLGAVVDAHLGPASGALVFGVKRLGSIAKAALHAIRLG